MLKYKFDLQTFAEGGDGGAAGEGNGVATGVADHGDDIQIPSFIPEKKKDLFLRTVKKTRSASEQKVSEAHPQEPAAEAPTATPKTEKRQTFAELVESEDFKAEREAYMHDAFKRRFKSYEGMEAENAAAKELLASMAEKYNVSQDSKTFMEDLRKAMNSDESAKKVEAYMKQHDVDEDEARRVVEMESTLAEKARTERIQAQVEKQMQERKAQEDRMNALKDSAAKTKEKYPEFDLASEMKNEQFIRMLAATGGNTTMAYVATHHEELMSSTARKAADDASLQIANAVAANKKRPSEGAIGNAPSSVAEIDLKNLSKEERRKAFQAYIRRG